ncbi:MAG TPA: glycosyltransferase [Chitinophagales bacterium]|nr:glycosyltransferase [Chitinophagales bacterium]
MKEVSIIVPSIEWEPFTEQCITTCASLFPESEIILVLDDDAPEKPASKNLTVLRQGGVISKKRNAGVKAAKTEFIAFIDSDAFPHKDWLSNALDILRTDKSVGIVGGPNISPPSQDKDRKRVSMASQSWLVAGKWRFYKSAKSSACYCDNLPSCNIILRKSLYEQMSGMNEELEVGEDTDLCARMIASGYRVYFTPKVIVYHYDRKIPGYLRQRMVRGPGCFCIFLAVRHKRKIFTPI